MGSKTVNLFIHSNKHSRDNIPKLEKCEAIGKEVRTTVGKAQEEEAGEGIIRWKYPITVELLPQLESGEQATLIDVKYNLNGEEREIQLPVNWHVNSLVEATPSRIFFGKSDNETGNVRRIVKLERKDGQILQIDKITASNEAVECSVVKTDPTDNTRCWFEVALLPNKVKHFAYGDIKVEIRDPKGRAIRIPFTVYK